MRQSIKERDATGALYVRLSKEDFGMDESYSIVNQKLLLTGIAREMGYTKLIIYVDDGVSGTNRDRKDFVRMLAELEKGYIGAVFIKDLSRLARDHIKADTLIEEFFPEHDIRLISVAEGLDTSKGEDEFTPFRNLMNEWYARDIGKKRKLTNVVKSKSGEPISLPPYGYIKDTDNPKRWIIEPEAASVVCRIYNMTIDGMGTEQIAKTLECEKVLTPVHYWRSKGLNRPARGAQEPYLWRISTIVKILSRQEYCGDIINFKTYSKSFRLKKRFPNAVENMTIIKDVHEPIIDRTVWEQLQQKRGKTRKRKTKESGKKNMFSGLLVCADCGSNLHYHFSQKNPEISYFNCANNNSGRGTCASNHYIRVDFLTQVVQAEVKRLMQYATKYESEFAKLLMGFSRQADTSQRERKQKELSAMRVRERELDKLFNRMYEDNVAGKIDDERFSKMTKQYSLEQKELFDKIKALSSELDHQADKSASINTFISNVRQYTRAKKLTERMLVALIERIEVHEAERINGERRQRLTIHYNCIGAIEIPKTFATLDVKMQTRKGVALTYEPSPAAQMSA